MIDVQKLARDAGMNVSMWNYGAGSMVFTLGIEGVARGAVERFARLVLEEAAKVCDEIWQEDGTAMQCREAIRSLKPTGEA